MFDLEKKLVEARKLGKRYVRITGESLREFQKENEADVIRMYHLEGKTYQEISSSVGMPENSIGPTLSRARAKMRQARAE